jgi:membrane protein
MTEQAGNAAQGPDPKSDRPAGKWGAFAQAFYHAWITERPTQFAAALAYYALFSFVPTIYIAFVLADLFIAQLAVSEWFHAAATKLLGAEMGLALQAAVADLAARTEGATALRTAIGFLVLVFTASLIFFQLQRVLNVLWHVPPPRRGATQALVRDRLLAFAMMFGVGPLFIVAASFSLVTSFLGSIVRLPGFVPSISFVGLAALAILCFALIYKVLPNARIAWRDVWLGAVVTGVPIMVILSFGGVLLGTARVRTALEAAGAVAVFLLGFYILGQVVVFGAMFTRVYASVFGSGIRPREDAAAPLSQEEAKMSEADSPVASESADRSG